MPDSTELKLLLPEDSCAAFLMQAARRKWVAHGMSEYEALYLFSGTRICMGTTRIKSLDTNQPDPVRLVIRKETTFG